LKSGRAIVVVFALAVIFAATQCRAYEPTDARCRWAFGFTIGPSYLIDADLREEFSYVLYDVNLTTKVYPYKYFSLVGNVGYKFGYGHPEGMIRRFKRKALASSAVDETDMAHGNRNYANFGPKWMEFSKPGTSQYSALPFTLGLRLEPMQFMPFNLWFGGFWGPQYYILRREGMFRFHQKQRDISIWDPVVGGEIGFDYIVLEQERYALALDFHMTWTFEHPNSNWTVSTDPQQINLFFQGKDFGGATASVGLIFYF